MANTIRLRRGLEADRTTITPAEGEMIYTTDTNSLYIGDGSTAGGVKFDFNLDDIDVDTITANQLDIKEAYFQALTNTLTGTAVATHIYIPALDDSDGGAWRKRCQHTSWYNETLNTATRGATREFPAVAGIVAESNKVTIYDMSAGDPVMWMVFNTASGNAIGASTPTSVVMVNGILVVGTTGAAFEIRFISDEGHDGYTNQHYVFKGNISERNNAKGFALLESIGIVNATVNDVAMTVLPNAPIDDATGLPIPTIAVATNGGVSVIKDDGTVVDSSYTASIPSVAFTSDHRIVYQLNNYGVRIGDIPNADIASDNFGEYYRETGSAAASTNPRVLGDAASGYKVDSVDNVTVIRGGDAGLTLLHENPTTPAEGSVAYITSKYNTGWMNGDIKAAFCLDTDTTALSGSELITNGTFDTDVSGWSNDATPTLTWNAGGYADIDRNGGSAAGQCYQNITCVVGETYIIAYEVVARSHNVQLYLDLGVVTLTGNHIVSSVGTYFAQFVATSTTHRLDVSATGSTTATCSVDNILARLAVPDRSVANNSIGVHGTLTVTNPDGTAAADNDELKVISGFSASNYLEQPYNSDLDFGTGDFYVMGWFKESDNGATAEYLFSRGTLGGWTGSNIIMYIASGGTLYVGITDDGFTTSDSLTSSVAYDDDVWHHGALSRNGSTFYLYADGELIDSQVATNAVGSLSNSSAVFQLGLRSAGLNNPLTNGTLDTRWKAAGNAISAAEIKRIYNEERPMFYSGAKVVLAGTSDAITALDHDSETNELHAGTSGGRSVFQGLVRTDSDTAATSQSLTSISAKNGELLEGK